MKVGHRQIGLVSVPLLWYHYRVGFPQTHRHTVMSGFVDAILRQLKHPTLKGHSIHRTHISPSPTEQSHNLRMSWMTLPHFLQMTPSNHLESSASYCITPERSTVPLVLHSAHWRPNKRSPPSAQSAKSSTCLTTVLPTPLPNSHSMPLRVDFGSIFFHQSQALHWRCKNSLCVENQHGG